MKGGLFLNISVLIGRYCAYAYAQLKNVRNDSTLRYSHYIHLCIFSSLETNSKQYPVHKFWTFQQKIKDF